MVEKRVMTRYTIVKTEEWHYEYMGTAHDLQKLLKQRKRNKIREIVPKGQLIKGPELVDNHVSHVAEFDLETGEVFTDG